MNVKANITKMNMSEVKRYVKFHILHTDDSTHKIAMGAALGFWVAWIPLIGLHMALVLGLCVFLKANKLVGFLCVWVSNPFTFIPIFYFNYLVGRWLMKLFGATVSEETPMFFRDFHALDFFSGFFQAAFWREVLEMVSIKWVELWAGSIVMSIPVGTAAYFAMYFLVGWYRRVHGHKISEGL